MKIVRFAPTLLFVLGALTPAVAQDEAGEADADEEAVDLAEDEAPSVSPTPAMADAIEYSDRGRTMFVRLPKTWKALKESETPPGMVVSFAGFLLKPDDGPNGFVNLEIVRAHDRAVLAHHMLQHAAGTIQPETLRTGPAHVESCVFVDHPQQPKAEWVRYLEKDGTVYAVHIVCHRSAFEPVRRTAEAILDSFRVAVAAPAPTPPAGWNVKKMGAFDVWSDTDDDKARTTVSVDLAAGAREVVVKALDGKPLDDSRPVLRAYQNGAKFDEDAKAARGEAPRSATLDEGARAVMVKLLLANDTQTPAEVRRSAAEQYVQQYFGGPVPYWVQAGLAEYGVLGAETGKPQKPTAETIALAGSHVVAGKRRLDQWLDVYRTRDVVDEKQGAYEAWAWHWYFRHGGGKKYRKAYENYLAKLRATGDPAEARKVWDGTDFDAMLQDFRDWAAKWKG